MNDREFELTKQIGGLCVTLKNVQKQRNDLKDALNQVRLMLEKGRIPKGILDYVKKAIQTFG